MLRYRVAVLINVGNQKAGPLAVGLAYAFGFYINLKGIVFTLGESKPLLVIMHPRRIGFGNLEALLTGMLLGVCHGSGAGGAAGSQHRPIGAGVFGAWIFSQVHDGLLLLYGGNQLVFIGGAAAAGNSGTVSEGGHGNIAQIIRNGGCAAVIIKVIG